MKVEDSPGQKRRRICAGAWVSADSALKMKGSGTPKKHHRTSKSTERACTFDSKFARLHVRFHTRRDVYDSAFMHGPSVHSRFPHAANSEIKLRPCFHGSALVMQAVFKPWPTSPAAARRPEDSNRRLGGLASPESNRMASGCRFGYIWSLISSGQATFSEAPSETGQGASNWFQPEIGVIKLGKCGRF